MASSKLTPSTGLGLFIIHTVPSKQEKENGLQWTFTLDRVSCAPRLPSRYLRDDTVASFPSDLALAHLQVSPRMCQTFSDSTQRCPEELHTDPSLSKPYLSSMTLSLTDPWSHCMHFNNSTQKKLVPPTHLGGSSAFPALHGHALQRDLSHMTGPLIHKLSSCLKTHSAESKGLSRHFWGLLTWY